MKKQIVVIGLGRFGTSIAETLASTGHDILAIDRFEKNTQAIAPRVTHAIQADATSEAVLKELGINTFDIAIVAIGSSIENSVLATILLKKLGVPRVLARANNDLHKTILERIGADLVISPEMEMGRRLAHGAVMSGVTGYLDVQPNYGIAKLNAPQHFIGKSLTDLAIGPRGKQGTALLLIKRDKELIISPAEGEIIRANDTLILAGDDDHMTKLLVTEDRH